MKVKEVRETSSAELTNQIAKARVKLFKFRFHATNEEMQRAGDIRKTRREIARMKTILREREMAEAKAAAAPRATGRKPAKGRGNGGK
ncbi:MAG: 50S ribosomal protein L29 [Planctomycetes bacterium]|nr:50S ribosomal protein L29 [Planctomycetota bacterium]